VGELYRWQRLKVTDLTTHRPDWSNVEAAAGPGYTHHLSDCSVYVGDVHQDKGCVDLTEARFAEWQSFACGRDGHWTGRSLEVVLRIAGHGEYTSVSQFRRQRRIARAEIQHRPVRGSSIEQLFMSSDSHSSSPED
jgi:hypothetical protein